ncbi:hypothetical protein LSAT2_025049, partial [Lamellibrachia satsuma]
KNKRNNVADALSRNKLQPKESINSNVCSFSMLHEASLPDDSLPEEAMHDEEMVNDMFLLRLQRQRDLQSRQHWATVFVPATTTITAARPQQSQHDLTVETCTSSMAIGVDDYTSSALACKAIFTADPSTTVTVPTRITAMDQASQQIVVKVQAGFD